MAECCGGIINEININAVSSRATSGVRCARTCTPAIIFQRRGAGGIVARYHGESRGNIEIEKKQK